MEENKMSIVNFTSGINKIEGSKSLSEWAVEYISVHNLTRENFNSHESFRMLPRREKDAIRYQIRKGTPTGASKPVSKKPEMPRITRQPRPKNTINYLKVAKIGLGVWISCFLLIDIAKIYLTKGASPVMAWQTAILVELCIVCASMSPRLELRRVAYAFFAYNVLIFGFMEVDIALNNSQMLQSNLAQIYAKEAQIRTLNNQINEQDIASKDNLKRLGISHKLGYITSGTLSFERVSHSLKESSERAKGEVLRLEKEVANIQNQSHTPFWIWISAALYFLLRCLLQLYSIRLLEKKNAT
jgi:hypothetical protein